MANRFWVGGTGNWDASDTTHWSATSGGAGGETVPTTSDIVTFDSLSGGGTVTGTATMNCASFTGGTFTGTFNLNGQTLNCINTFTISGTGTRTFTFGTSTVNCGNFTAIVTTNLTFNIDTSTININAAGGTLRGGNLTYNIVNLTGSSLILSGTNTYGSLTISPTTPAKTNFLTLENDQIITGTFTVSSGATVTNRVLVFSNVIGTQRTITAATVTVSNIDLRDIIGAGAGNWDISAVSGGSGDCGGNSGITFTTGATQYYQTGTSANWSTIANWFLGTNGTGGAGRVPLPQDTARFDANSITAGSVVITQDMPRIGAVDWTNVGNTPTWTTSTTCQVYGSITLVSGMTLSSSSSTYSFFGRGTMNLTSATKTWGKPFILNAITGSLVLQDALTLSSGNTITVTSGTFNANNQNVTAEAFICTGSETRTVTMGSGNWSVVSQWNIGTTNLTFNKDTANITITGNGASFNGGGLTYNTVTSNGGGNFTISGTNTFSTLNITGIANQLSNLILGANQTITTGIGVNGNSLINRILVRSSVIGTSRIITTAGITSQYSDWRDITGAGAASWDLSAITGGSGDCGGNSGITFTTPVTQTATGTSSFTWSTHGWTSRVPLPQDDVIINNSFIGGQTVTIDKVRLGKNLTFGCSGSPTVTFTTSVSLFGSLDLTGIGSIGGSTLNFNFSGRGSHTITSGGISLAGMRPVSEAYGGTYTLIDDFFTNDVFNWNYGTFDANDNDVTCTFFQTSGQTSRTILMGSGTWFMTITSTSTAWNIVSGSSNLIIIPETSTIKINGSTTNVRTFSGLGFTYYNLWFSNATNGGQLNITGSNSFNDLKAGIEGNAQILSFTAGTTQTIKTFTVSGASGNLITLKSSSTSTFNLIKSNGGIISCDFLNIQHSIATPSSTWFAGTGSTDNQAVEVAGSGWIFTAPDGAVINVGPDADVLTLTENVNLEEISDISINDLITISDIGTQNLEISDLNIDIFEIITLTENFINTGELSLNIFDIITIGEDVNLNNSNEEINTLDSINISENLDVSLPIDINVFNVITITEDISINNPSGFTDIFDLINITENLDVSIPININVSDSISITEDLILDNSTESINIFDSIVLSEDLNFTILSPDLFSISLNDLISISENINIYQELIFISIYDSIILTENEELINSLTDIIVSDSIHVLEQSKTYDESDYTYDDIRLTYDGHYLPIELISFISVSDNLNITDNFSNTIGDLYIDIYDEIVLNEYITSSQESYISTYDIINITENFNNLQFLFINVSESILIFQNINPNVISYLDVYDSIILTEDILIIEINDVSVSDQIDITENIETGVESIVSIFDNILLTENIDSVATLGDISVNNDINITENIQTERINNVTVSDVVEITELVTMESFRFSPSLTKPVGRIKTNKVHGTTRSINNPVGRVKFN